MKSDVLRHPSAKSQLLNPFLVYLRDSFHADLFGGTTLALLAMPQSMAYALRAGIEPKYGLNAFIVASVVGAVFGSSRHLQTGPVNVVSILVASTLAGYVDRDLAGTILLLTLMVGILQLAAGLLRLGNLTQFNSRSVLEGFIGAGGLLIVVNQLPNLLRIPSRSSLSILEGIVLILANLARVHVDTLGIGVGTMALVILLKQVSPKTKRGLPVIPTLYWLKTLSAPVYVALRGSSGPSVIMVQPI